MGRVPLSYQTGSSSGSRSGGGTGDDGGVEHVSVVARGDGCRDVGVRGGQHSDIAEDVVHVGALGGRRRWRMDQIRSTCVGLVIT